MGIVSALFGSKKKVDYAGMADSIAREKNELKALVADWKKLPEADYYQKRIEALQDEKYHPMARLVVGVAGWDPGIDDFVVKLKEAAAGDISAVREVEDTLDKIYDLITHEITRLQKKIKSLHKEEVRVQQFSASEGAVWRKKRVDALYELSQEKELLKIAAPNPEDSCQLRLFVQKRIERLENPALSLPGRLVWSLSKEAEETTNKYLYDIFLFLSEKDENKRKELEFELHKLENSLSAMVVSEAKRLRREYAKLLEDHPHGQGGIP